MKIQTIILGLLLALRTAGANTITVTSTADSGVGTLRGALASAVDGDTIDTSGVSGTILLTSGELLVSKSVTIAGPGPAILAVDGNHSSRVFDLTSSGGVSISGLAITHGSADYGGGISGGDVTLTHCLVSSNSASQEGGGLDCDTASLSNCTFIGNSSENGGGMVAYFTATLASCSFVSNTAVGYGGGIYNRDATLTLSNSTFSDNLAVGGAGIMNESIFYGTAVTVVNSTISGNAGEGIRNQCLWDYPQYAYLTVLNSTIASNTPSGIVNDGGDFGQAELDIGSTILKAGASAGTIESGSGSVYSMGYNLSSDNGGGRLSPAIDLINTDPMLGPLQDNGGPTFTHALLPGSPAIDKGTNFTGSATDQRGVLRTVDFPTISNPAGGDGTDVGAVEVQNHPPVARCRNVILGTKPGSTANASIDAGSFDPDAGDIITLVQSPSGPYPIGTNAVMLTVTDSLGVSDSCSAQVIIVDDSVITTADSGPGSLRAALAIAADGTTIDCAVTGTILLTSGELLVTNSVSIVGPGPGNLMVNGNSASRVLHISPDTVVSISGLTIANGHSFAPFPGIGGGILSEQATVTITNCAVSGNRADTSGGGIYFINGGSLTIANSTIGFNSTPSSGQGGGIYFAGGRLAIANSTLNNNDAGQGAALYHQVATIFETNSTIAYSSFSGNYASGYGGGIYNNAKLAITNSILSDNESAGAGFGAGGGIFNSATLTIAESTLTGNQSLDSGGAIANTSSGVVTIARCTVSSNSASGAGGGIANGNGSFGGGTVAIVNSTLSGNSANFGGGIGDDSLGGTAKVTILNSTLSGNSANFGTGGSIWSSCGGGVTIGGSVLNAGGSGTNITACGSGSVLSLGYNLSSDDGGGYLNQPTDLLNTDPMLGPLQDNCGPTFTHALLAGSPAIDKGKSFGSSTDQRGSLRPYDDGPTQNAVGGDGSDIGAFEVAPPLVGITLTPTVGAKVYWPSPWPGWNLQVNTNLVTTNWVTPAETVQDNGTIKYIIVNPPTGSSFYRLKNP